MPNNEYTTQELIDLVKSKSVNGKLSIENLALIIFDARFPQKLSENAIRELTEASTIYKRYLELANDIFVKYESISELQKQIENINKINDGDEEIEDIIVDEIMKLKWKQNDIKDLISSLENEFNELNQQIKKYSK